MTFGDRLRTARSSGGFKSQKDMAAALGVERTRYVGWENGVNRPSIDMLVKICELLNVSADYLLGLSEVMDLHKIKKPAELADLGVEQVQKTGGDQLTPAEIKAIRAILALRTPLQD